MRRMIAAALATLAILAAVALDDERRQAGAARDSVTRIELEWTLVVPE